MILKKLFATENTEFTEENKERISFSSLTHLGSMACWLNPLNLSVCSVISVAELPLLR
jgi:hypothetical protein